jgi:hypothetical protein
MGFVNVLKVASRLSAIKNWIGFSNQYQEKWKEIAFKFLHWFHDKFKASLITKDDIGNKFPVLWFYLVN